MTPRLPFTLGRRLFAAKDGASTAEFAIVLPGFMLLLLGVLEFARVFWAANALQFAVSQSARYVMTSPSGSTGRPTLGGCATWTPGDYQTSINNYLRTQLTAWSLSSATPTADARVDCGASPPTMKVTVSASYTFTFWLTELGSLLPTMPLTQRAEVTTPLSL